MKFIKKLISFKLMYVCSMSSDMNISWEVSTSNVSMIYVVMEYASQWGLRK